MFKIQRGFLLLCSIFLFTIPFPSYAVENGMERDGTEIVSEIQEDDFDSDSLTAEEKRAANELLYELQNINIGNLKDAVINSADNIEIQEGEKTDVNLVSNFKNAFSELFGTIGSLIIGAIQSSWATLIALFVLIVALKIYRVKHGKSGFIDKGPAFDEDEDIDGT